MRDYPVDPQRVYVAGLSAGGAAAAIMGATYPDLYAAVGVHSGLAVGAASDMPSAFAAMQGGAAAHAASGRVPMAGQERIVPTIVFHGDQDRTVNPRNGDQVIAQARSASATALQATATVQQGQVAGGRAYRRTLHADAAGADRARAVGDPWRRPCLVGRQPRRLLHRSARARCHARDAPLLPRAPPSHRRPGGALNGREPRGRRVTSAGLISCAAMRAQQEQALVCRRLAEAPVAIDTAESITLVPG